jgi:hypothetical protein
MEEKKDGILNFVPVNHLGSNEQRTETNLGTTNSQEAVETPKELKNNPPTPRELTKSEDKQATQEKKNKVGRPLKWQTVEELEEEIEKYFKSCLKPSRIKETGEIEYDASGNEVYVQFRPFTISGLAVQLDTDRRTLIEYQERDQFTNAIRRAKRKCENYTEESLFRKESTNGAKFVLINGYGWADVREITTNSNNLPQLSQDLLQLTAQDVSKIAALFQALKPMLAQSAQYQEIPATSQKE